MPDFREAWLLGAWLPVLLVPTLWAPRRPSGHVVCLGRGAPGGPSTQSPQQAPPRKPAVPLQRGDSNTEERLVPAPSAAEGGRGAPSRLGDPRSSGGAGVGTQAPPSWEGGSSPQINCSKCDTGVIRVARKALGEGTECVSVCQGHIRRSGRG